MNFKHLICGIVAGLTLGYWFGLELGYGIGKREIQKQAIDNGFASNKYVMAGFKSHYEFEWRGGK